jgi:hypothetical protein
MPEARGKPYLPCLLLIVVEGFEIANLTFNELLFIFSLINLNK